MLNVATNSFPIHLTWIDETAPLCSLFKTESFGVTQHSFDEAKVKSSKIILGNFPFLETMVKRMSNNFHLPVYLLMLELSVIRNCSAIFCAFWNGSVCWLQRNRGMIANFIHFQAALHSIKVKKTVFISEEVRVCVKRLCLWVCMYCLCACDA